MFKDIALDDLNFLITFFCFEIYRKLTQLFAMLRMLIQKKFTALTGAQHKVKTFYSVLVEIEILKFVNFNHKNFR